MIRKAVGAIVFQGEEILLVYKVRRSLLAEGVRHFAGEWDFPKGGVEDSDFTIEASIVRELKEETGSTQYKLIKPFEEKVCFSFDQDFANKTGYTEQETTMFLVEYIGDRTDLAPVDDHEIGDIKFFPKDEVMDILTNAETKRWFECQAPTQFSHNS